MPSSLFSRGNEPSPNNEAGDNKEAFYQEPHLSQTNLIQDFASGFPKLFTSAF